MRQEVLMMLAKVHYLMGQYEVALIRLVELNLDKVDTISSVNIRRLKIVGESYAIRGQLLLNS